MPPDSAVHHLVEVEAPPPITVLGLPPTLAADQLAALLGVSRWSIYTMVKNGTCPVEPIHLGRKLRWPTAKVLELLGLNEESPAA